MKKRTLYLLLLLLIPVFLTGCGSKNNDKTPSSVSATSTPTQSVNSSFLQTNYNIEEKVILDKNGIKVTAKSIKYDYDSTEIKLLIENDSNQDITVQNRNFSINEIMIDPIMSADVAIGKKANTTISIFNKDLEKSHITAIKDIDFDLIVLNAESFNTLFDEKGITLHTNATNYIQKYNTEGYLAVDRNNIKVYVLKLKDKDSFWGADVTVYIENNSNEPVTVQARDVSINGFMVDPIFSSDLMPGKKIYDEITFFESDLKDNDIADITNIELKFTIFNSDTYRNIFDTDILKIDF